MEKFHVVQNVPAVGVFKLNCMKVPLRVCPAPKFKLGTVAGTHAEKTEPSGFAGRLMFPRTLSDRSINNHEFATRVVPPTVDWNA